jgi:hypothetical protein
LPARSQVARPSKRVNATPLIAAPSRPTRLAGTSNRTHCPAGGSGPMYRLLFVPSVPQVTLLAPQ